MSDELITAILCEKMGWTYNQMLDNPHWFNLTILLKMGIEGEYSKQQSKKK